MRVTVLASGSGGNCILVESDRTRVLVDAGLPAREIAKRMERSFVPVRLDDVQAVCLTHEHTDHASGVPSLASAGLAIFATEGTARAAGLKSTRVLEPGMVLGEAYRIHSVVGEGGFGRVFQCTNWQGRFCAVKTLRPNHLTDPDMIGLMRKEIQRSVELGVHPHIVTAFGLVEHGTVHHGDAEQLRHVYRRLPHRGRNRGQHHYGYNLHFGGQRPRAVRRSLV